MKPVHVFCLLLFFCSTTAFASPSPKQKILYARAYGFSTSASALANTQALQKISSYINAAGGGITLVFDKGTYRVGSERFAGANDKGYSYRGDSLLSLSTCTKPVIIEGNNAVLKLADNLHFGSFDPISGAAYQPAKGGFTNYSYAAYPGNVFDFRNNASVQLRNLVIDGNLQNLNIGGYWGDVGIQLPADGIYAFNNSEIVLEKVTSRYCGRDGLQVGNQTPNESSPVRRISILDCVFDGNVRQGFSWVGGNQLIAVRTQFINTGKTVSLKTGTPLRSSPAAGVDMEAELGLIRNGVFTDCTISNNDGAGFLTVGDVANIAYSGGKIIGTTNWSIYGSGPRATFVKTLIVGSPVNLRIGNGPMDPLNARFDSCRITLDSSFSPNGKVFGNYVMDFGGGAGGFFNNCVIDSHVRGTVYGGDGCVFTNCTFIQRQPAPGFNGYPFMRGNFYGTNRWYRPGAGYKLGDGSLSNLEKSKIYGPFYVNDVEIGTGFKQSK